jgi:hypothetical protein
MSLVRWPPRSKHRIMQHVPWFCQVVEAEALIRRASASPQSYLSFRRPAPYLSLRPNSRIASASLDDSRPLIANAVWVGSVRFQPEASITVSATFGRQKTQSASSNALYLWDVRVLSSQRIAWGGRRDDQGPPLYQLFLASAFFSEGDSGLTEYLLRVGSIVMKPPRSKLRGITRKGVVCETPRFLTLFPLQGNLGASSEESPDSTGQSRHSVIEA